MLKNMLLGLDSVWLDAECSRYEFFSDVVGQTKPDIGVVSLDSNPEKALKLMESLRDSGADCAIGDQQFHRWPIDFEGDAGRGQGIPHHPPKGGGLGYRAGSDFSDQVWRLRGASRKSHVIAICGATGGVGQTSLAVNLGCVFAAERRNSVVLLDLDLALGDADVFLDAIPDYTIVDVVQNISRLDFTLLKRSLTKHSSGLYLLPRPVNLQDTAHISPEDLTRVIGLLKATFTHLVIDLSKTYNDLDMVVLKNAKDVLLVTQLDLPCLRNVVRLFSSFGEVEGLKDKVKVIVNCAGLESGQISLKKCKRRSAVRSTGNYRTIIARWSKCGTTACRSLSRPLERG